MQFSCAAIFLSKGMCSKPSNFSKPFACNHSILMPVNSLRTSGSKPRKPCWWRWQYSPMVSYIHRGAGRVPRGTFSSCGRRSTRPWFVSRRCGCLENGLPLLGRYRLQLLAAAALRTGSVTLSSRSRRNDETRRCFFGCPGASKSALRRCGAGWFTDRPGSKRRARGAVCGGHVSCGGL